MPFKFSRFHGRTLCQSRNSNVNLLLLRRCSTLPVHNPCKAILAAAHSLLIKTESIAARAREPPPAPPWCKLWADACATALNSPLHTLLHTVYASYGVTVSWRLPLLSRVLTPARADGGVLRERCRGRDHVLAVVQDGGGAWAARVAAVRLLQRADVRGQRVWRRHVDVLAAAPPPPPLLSLTTAAALMLVVFVCCDCCLQQQPALVIAAAAAAVPACSGNSCRY